MNAIITNLQQYVVDVVSALAVLLIGLTVALLVRKLVSRLLEEVNINKTLKKVHIDFDAQRWIGFILFITILLVTSVATLETLGIVSIVLYLFVGAVLMLVIVGFLVGLKDVIPNLIGWLFIQNNAQLKVGKTISLQDVHGRIEHIGFLETEIVTSDCDILLIPNSLFVKYKKKVKAN